MLKQIDKDKFLDCLPERDVFLAAGEHAFDVFIDSLGNFSVVVIRSRTGQLFAGVSKRNPCDRPGEVGFCVAAVRAWRSFQGRDPGYCRQRPVSKKEAKQISARDLVFNALDRNG